MTDIIVRVQKRLVSFAQWDYLEYLVYMGEPALISAWSIAQQQFTLLTQLNGRRSSTFAYLLHATHPQ